MKNSWLKIIFIVIFVFCYFSFNTALVSAAVQKTLEMPLPGISTIPADPGTYVRYLFLFGLSALAFLSVGALVVGGIQYMLAGSLISSTEKAKTAMKAAIGGLALLLCSYLLLYTIDPTLTNLSPKVLEPIDIPAVVAEFDIDTSGLDTADIRSLVSQGKISGSAGSSCSVSQCGEQTVQGHKLSGGAANNYLSLQDKIKQACTSQGLNCDTSITSSLDGQHASSCHKPGNEKSGTCGDFVITAPECGGSIKLCPAAKKEQYIQIASSVLGSSGAGNVKSCLNEYKVRGSAYTTGGHFHCNF